MLFLREEDKELVADAVEDDPPPPLLLLAEEVISISLASSMFSSACETPTMRLMVGVGRERDQHREKCLSVSRKSVVFFFVMMLDVGTIFFLFGFFCSVFVICGVLMSPFFFGVGKEGAHFKRTRCTLFKLFSTRPHTFFSFFIINHLTKRSEKNTPRRTP
jgi:hypothetical protein